jgi:hypothetical protein
MTTHDDTLAGWTTAAASDVAPVEFAWSQCDDEPYLESCDAQPVQRAV